MKDLRALTLIPEPTCLNGGGLAAWKFKSSEISMLCETQCSSFVLKGYYFVVKSKK